MEKYKFILPNIFGKDHAELHALLEKLLFEKVDFCLLIDYLKSNSCEQKPALMRYSSSNRSLFGSYFNTLYDWCIDVSEDSAHDNNRIRLNLSREKFDCAIIKPKKEIFHARTIKGTFLNSQSNQREILLNDYSILINEDILKDVMEIIQEDGLKTYKPLYTLLAEKPNSYFKEANHDISGVIFTDNVSNYMSEFNSEYVFNVSEIFDENISFDLYRGAETFDEPELKRPMFLCFNSTLHCGNIYDTLLKYGYSHKEALHLSGLETETHLKLRTLLKEKYVDNDDFEEEELE